MASNSANPKGDKSKGKAAVTMRRYWILKEEEVLLNLLEAMVVNEAWKCDGTFRGGYMLRLEREMNEKLPGCGLTKKNIRNKMTVWKKTHFAIQGMIGSSGAAGFSMDPTMNVIIEEKPDAWAEWGRANPNELKLVKGKSFPWHVRWKFIFGTDNAAGVERVDMTDAREAVGHKDKMKETITGGNSTYSNFDGTNTEFDEDDASSKGSSKEAEVVKGATSKKTKALVDDPAKITTMIGDWMESTKETIGAAAEKMMGTAAEGTSQQTTDSTKRALIYNAVAEVSDLPMEDVIKVTRHLSHNFGDQDIFWGMPQTARGLFVGMILGGLNNP